MPADASTINLTHHFLIAMPGLEDESFARSVIYLCEHSARGALGLVINKPSDIKLKNLFEKVDLPLDRDDLATRRSSRAARCRPSAASCCTRRWPPGAKEGDDESVYASTMTIPGGLEMTTSKDVLEAMSTGAGPRKVLVSLGYSAWGEGQLESELAENSWLTVGADPAVIFDTPIEQRYDKALALLGLQAWMLSPRPGTHERRLRPTFPATFHLSRFRFRGQAHRGRQRQPAAAHRHAAAHHPRRGQRRAPAGRRGAGAASGSPTRWSSACPSTPTAPATTIRPGRAASAASCGARVQAAGVRGRRALQHHRGAGRRRQGCRRGVRLHHPGTVPEEHLE
jgi:putative transcriptional regulator